MMVEMEEMVLLVVVLVVQKGTLAMEALVELEQEFLEILLEELVPTTVELEDTVFMEIA